MQEGCNSVKGDHCPLAHTMLEGTGGFSLRKGGRGAFSLSITTGKKVVAKRGSISSPK